MENLEIILKNKKNIIIIICIIVILITTGAILFISYTQDSQEEIITLEQMEQELEGNQKEENREQENEITQENEVENEKKETIAIHITGEVKNKGIIYPKQK